MLWTANRWTKKVSENPKVVEVAVNKRSGGEMKIGNLPEQDGVS